MENKQMEQEFLQEQQRMMYTQQSIINALFRAVEMAGETGKTKADMLASIIMSNRWDVLNEREDMLFVEGLVQQLQNELLNSLKSDQPHNKETHEELIHAYVSLSKALEYKCLTASLPNQTNNR